ncbi:MAG: D-serine ammonia-lyase [Steroidobacteraceae bacterium]
MSEHPHRSGDLLPAALQSSLARRTPLLWINEHWRPFDAGAIAAALDPRGMYDAEVRLSQYAVVLKRLFPELTHSQGIIESPLLPADRLQRGMMPARGGLGRWMIKADHTLPIAGSIKARGGLYEVLVHAETLALHHGLMHAADSKLMLALPAARELFARHHVAVGSTGNLGLSIGVMSAALGFQTTVHMSADAKPWKKARLRDRGVQVVEHAGDFTAAVAAGREQSAQLPNAYFVDDENSAQLFWGYSVAALRLQKQLQAQGIQVDAQHPLCVYLPCGVGGAPGGVTYGLRCLYGDHVHCFFAEPVAAPCMLVRLAATHDRPLSVRELGLDGRTEADGLSVARASEFVAPLMRPLVSGVFTVPDEQLFEDLYELEQCEGLRIEPSAAAGLRGPGWLLESAAGRQYLSDHHMEKHMNAATHILWTTGGALVPDEEYRRFHECGRGIRAAR